MSSVLLIKKGGGQCFLKPYHFTVKRKQVWRETGVATGLIHQGDIRAD